jgi:MFS family permease
MTEAGPGPRWQPRLGVPPLRGRGGLVAAMVVDSLGSGLFVPFALLYFLRTTPLSLTAVGAGLTVAGLVALPAPLALGQLIDRWQPKTVVAAGNLLSAAAFVGYLFVGSQPELVVAALAASVGQRTFWTGTRPLIAEIAGHEQRQRRSWFAFQSMTRNAGYGLGGLFGAATVSLNTPAAFHALALVNAVSYLTAAVLLLRWRPPRPDPRAAAVPMASPAAAAPAAVDYRTVLADRRLWALTVPNLVFVLCQSVLSVLLSVYLVDTLHEPAWLGGVLYTVNTVLVVVGQTSLTTLTSHRDAPRLLRLAALSWAGSFAVLWALAAVPHPGLGPLPAVALAGFGMLFTLAEMLAGPTINTLAVDLAPAQAPGRHLAIFQISWSLGTALAPALLTWLLARGPAWPWATLIALCALTAAAVTRVGRAGLAEAGQQGVRGQIPPAVHRRSGGAEPPGSLLHGQPLGQGEEPVGDVDLVAVENPGVDAAPDPVHDELAGGRPGLPLGRAGIEVSERPGEHDLCQCRVVPGEDPEHPYRAEQVSSRIVRLPQPPETVPEEPEALEEHLPDQAGLVAEELVDGRRRRLGLVGDIPGGEPPDPVSGQHRHCHLHDVLAQLTGPLLGSGHCRVLRRLPACPTRLWSAAGNRLGMRSRQAGGTRLVSLRTARQAVPGVPRRRHR